MSMHEFILEENKTTAATGTTRTMNTTPFVPGTQVMAYIETDLAYAGKPDIEGSDDGGTTWSIVWSPGTIVAATGPHTMQKVITLKEKMRLKWTRTAGTIVKASLVSAV